MNRIIWLVYRKHSHFAPSTLWRDARLIVKKMFHAAVSTLRTMKNRTHSRVDRQSVSEHNRRVVLEEDWSLGGGGVS